ncbi:FAD/FMN-containing dehydrogenase [Haloactinopolyspora alba]|uniref:FAD/FMN-containing dehydrogenase n=1 Tax=Haloactinopolyspora alba TaxID=648780 RepID=A0A2P8E507_9ACTN|nr:FAD-binding oxidoreductase [Haloactinopolyspora alba]PSL04554.1 FAD/FMN-containing dehydrogenase [Haloactinopolyspora alba]
MSRRTTTTAATATIDDAIAGRVLVPGEHGYDGARSLWNAMVDRRPKVIVQCAGRDDVAAAIRYARQHDLEIGIKGGGHSVIGHAVPEDGLMLDLTPMNAVTVDPAARRARIQGGALLGALDQATRPYGLATTAGNVSHTGVGGLTLGGGMGWLARQFGLSCDNVESFEVVTATGETVTASATENGDLHWALRGGGGNFGVVTEFEFRLHPVAGQAVVAAYGFTLDDAAQALRRWRDLIESAPRQATLKAWVGTDGDRPRASLGFVWVGDPDGSRDLQRQFAAIGTAVDRSITEHAYVDLQRLEDDVEGHAWRRYWKGHYLRELPDEAIEAFLLRGTPDGSGELLPNASLQAYGGAIADVGDDETAFSHRDALVEFVSASRWGDSGEDDGRIAAARRYGATIEPYASGAYVNALTDEGIEGVGRAYPQHKLAGLTAVKDRWDPDNVFHLNHNVSPSGR